MALAVAANVNEEVTTSSPGPTPSRMRAKCKAAVPLERAAPWAHPSRSHSSASKASTCAPNGAIQFESKASRSSSRYVDPMWGGDRYILAMAFAVSVGGARMMQARRGAGKG